VEFVRRGSKQSRMVTMSLDFDSLAIAHEWDDSYIKVRRHLCSVVEQNVTLSWNCFLNHLLSISVFNL
jgi:hypothetical protein